MITRKDLNETMKWVRLDRELVQTLKELLLRIRKEASPEEEGYRPICGRMEYLYEDSICNEEYYVSPDYRHFVKELLGSKTFLNKVVYFVLSFDVEDVDEERIKSEDILYSISKYIKELIMEGKEYKPYEMNDDVSLMKRFLVIVCKIAATISFAYYRYNELKQEGFDISKDKIGYRDIMTFEKMKELYENNPVTLAWEEEIQAE